MGKNYVEIRYEASDRGGPDTDIYQVVLYVDGIEFQEPFRYHSTKKEATTVGERVSSKLGIELKFRNCS